MPPFPVLDRRFRLPTSITLEIYALYCFGHAPDEIRQVMLTDNGFQVSRTTIYHLLSPSQRERPRIYEKLKEHHRALRRRRRRSTAGRKHDSYSGRFERVLTGTLDPNVTTFVYPEGTVHAQPASLSVRLFQVYGDNIALAAFSYLENMYRYFNESLRVGGTADLYKSDNHREFLRTVLRPPGIWPPRAPVPVESEAQMSMVAAALRDATSKIET